MNIKDGRGQLLAMMLANTSQVDWKTFQEFHSKKDSVVREHSNTGAVSDKLDLKTSFHNQDE